MFGARIEIIESEYVGEPVEREHPHPERLKRYRQRRLKRWREKHPPYFRANGQYLTIDGGRTVICHRDDARKLRELFCPRCGCFMAQGNVRQYCVCGYVSQTPC